MYKRQELDPEDVMTWLQTGPLLVLAGDLEGYRHHCREMLRQFGDSDERPTIIVKACLLLPGTVDASGLPINTLARALDEGSAPTWLYKWGFAALAQAAYRAGDAEKAVGWIHKCQEAQGYADAPAVQALVLSLLAMAQHQLGNRDEASEALVQADTLVDEHLRKLASGEFKGWHDWLIAEVLRREATELIARPAKEPTPEAKATANPKTE